MRPGKSGSVNAIIELAVNDVIDPIDFAAQFFRIKIIAHVRMRGKRGVEHANDLRGLVVDDRAPLAVPQRRHRDFPSVLRIRGRVNLMEAKDSIVTRLQIINALRIGPAFGLRFVRERHRNDAFEFFQLAKNNGAVRPRT